MAPNTPLSVRNLVVYSVYVRNHSAQGTFAAVQADLPRIRSLGVDWVWFMPIHPIGQLNKKGSLGCPYSISDYRAVNPEYGTMQDFTNLVEAIHALGMKCMIDVVYNHTAHDAPLLKEHPEFYHQDADGNPVTTVPDWSDVIDLKHPNPDLTRYLIDSLLGWVRLGVDGFRCDVASLLPQEFWTQARREVQALKPDALWLAESVHTSFLVQRRRNGLSGISDAELFAAFDILYDYDIWHTFTEMVLGKVPPARYFDLLFQQEGLFPVNYAKMRYTENHDQRRIQDLAGTPERAMAWTAFAAFNAGPFLIYGGQESAARHTPSLFDIDRVEWGSFPLAPALTRLSQMKKHPAQRAGLFTLLSDAPALQAAWQHPENGLYGVFNTSSHTGQVPVQLGDGTYTDLLSGSPVIVQGGQVALPESAWILETGPLLNLNPWRSPLFG